MLQDAEHVPAFALVAACLYRMLRTAMRARPAPIRGAALAATGATALGAMVEVAQHSLHRDASLGDIGRDA